MIIKPSYGAYSQGISVYRDVARTTPAKVLRDMRALAAKEYPPVTVQRFIPSFGTQYEVRTYWVDEVYMYSVATFTSDVGTGKSGALSIDHKTSFRKEGGTLDDAILVKLKKLAALVFRCLPRYGDGKFPFLRIDFACCLRDNGSCFAYFVNEVETFWCNMLLADQMHAARRRRRDGVALRGQDGSIPACLCQGPPAGRVAKADRAEATRA